MISVGEALSYIMFGVDRAYVYMYWAVMVALLGNAVINLLVFRLHKMLERLASAFVAWVIFRLILSASGWVLGKTGDAFSTDIGSWPEVPALYYCIGAIALTIIVHWKPLKKSVVWSAK